FHKCAVRDEVDDPTLDLCAHGVFLLDGVPGIGQLLLQAQADALLLAVNIEHHNVNILANLEQFGGVPDAAPTHVGDVKQAIDAVQIDKRAEIRDALDGALPDVTRVRLAGEFLTALHSFLFKQFAPGQSNVLPLLVEFTDV